MVANPTSRDTRGGAGTGSRFVLAGLALVLLLSVILRVYRLDAQSVWGDEFFTGVAYLQKPQPLGVHLSLVSCMGDEIAPVYPVLQNSWARLVGTSLLALRSLSVLMGLVAILLMYGVGAHMYGRFGGLLAALCLAISPVHIWYSQALQPHGLVVLLALVSIYAFLKAVRHGNIGWWALGLTANLLLVWTHFLQIFLVLAELCVLAVYARRRLSTALLWPALHGLLLVPWMLLMLRIRPNNLEHLASVNAKDVLAAMVGNCTSALGISAPFWFERVPVAAEPVLLNAYAGTQVALACVFAVAIGWLAVKTVRSRCDSEGPVLLLVLTTLPAVVLASLTYCSGRPFLMERYVLYGLVARYVILSGLLSSLRVPWRRMLAVSLLGLIWAFQLALFLPRTTRTDWFSVVDHIESTASPHDIVVVDSVFCARMFQYHVNDDDLPIFAANNEQVLCDASVFFLGQDLGGEAASNEPRSVWFIHNQDWGNSPIASLEEKLSSYGLSFTYREFPMWEGVIVYRIAPPRSPLEFPGIRTPEPIREGPAYDNLKPSPYLAHLDQYDLDDLLQRLGDALPTRDFLPPDFFCACFLQVGNLQMAEAMARLRLDLWPDSVGEYVLGLVLAQKGDHAASTAAFQRAFNKPKRAILLLRALSSRLCESADYEAAYAQAKRLDETGHLWGVVLRNIGRRMLDPSGPVLPFGLWPMNEEPCEAILSAVAQPQWLDWMGPGALFLLGEVHGVVGRHDEALAFFQKAVDADSDSIYGRDRLNAALKKHQEAGLCETLATMRPLAGPHLTCRNKAAPSSARLRGPAPEALMLHGRLNSPVPKCTTVLVSLGGGCFATLVTR